MMNTEYVALDETDNVLIECGTKKQRIVDYLDNTEGLLKPLDYCIDYEFDQEEAFAFLDEDLPEGLFRKNKVSFIQDIVRLGDLFFKRTESKQIQIKLEIIQTDKCRFFHVDNYRQRLLCTYKGPGTEWLDNSNANRKGLGKGCNDTVVKDYSKVRRANEFDVLLLKGRKYGSRNLGVVHRSPPITHESTTRVLLRIDEC